MKMIKAFFIILFVIFLVLPEQAQSIPAFARKYGFSCSTCHLAVPKLKAYGDDFAANGFQLPEGQEPPRAYKNTGDDKLLLQKELPLAVRFDAYAQYNSKETVKSDLQTPYGLKLLSGGLIAKNIGYYFYFYFSEAGEISGIEDAYIHFNNIKGSEFDLMIGQFQICDPVIKRELRLTYEDYEIFKTAVGRTKTKLTYDRGIMATYDFPSKTNVTFELVNGNGKGIAGENGLFDGNNFKNVFFKLSQSFPYVDVGMFGYFGREQQEESTDRFSMFGPNVTIANDWIELNCHYVRRKDNNPYFNLTVEATEYIDKYYDIVTEGFIGEAALNLFPQKSELFGILLYNKIKSKSRYLNYETYTGNISYLFKRNLRLMAEATYDKANKNTRFTTGFVVGF